jgi:iron complex outermembrane receptor protein
MLKVYHAGLASTVALAALVCPAQSRAQTAGDPPAAANSEIIVTAQRRAEKVTSVPISITVADAGQLERQQVRTVDDLSRIAPSLEINAAPGQNTGGGGEIRGIGTQTFSQGAVASVGIVVDQVSQGNANISNLFDIARVEVLKGPQGTLFGLTTSAGVINITTNKPDPTRFSARFHTDLSGQGIAGSGFGNQVIQGVVNLPLAANAALRVSGATNLRQGPNYNTASGKYVDNNSYSGRAHLLWEPTSRLSFNVIGDYTHSTLTDGGDFFTIVSADASTAAALASCGIVAASGNQKFCAAQPLHARNENFGVSGQVDFDAGPFTLTSISAYRGTRHSDTGQNIARTDPTALAIIDGPGYNRLDLVTQELRIASPGNALIDYTGGLFVSHQRATLNPTAQTVTLFGFIPLGNSLGALSRTSDDSMALYGQATVHAADHLRLIAGTRFTTERLGLDNHDYDFGAITNQHLNTSNLSWKFGAQYDPARRTMVYATATRGYKSGQISVPAYPLTPYIVQPEIPTSYELGLKSTLLGGWVADLSLFSESIRNFQLQQCTNTATGAISCNSVNVDGVKSRGQRSACSARSRMICRSARASSTPRPPILPATPRVRRRAPSLWAAHNCPLLRATNSPSRAITAIRSLRRWPVSSASTRCGNRAWPINRPPCSPTASRRTGRWVAALA